MGWARARGGYARGGVEEVIDIGMDGAAVSGEVGDAGGDTEGGGSCGLCGSCVGKGG